MIIELRSFLRLTFIMISVLQFAVSIFHDDMEVRAASIISFFIITLPTLFYLFMT